MRWFYNLKISAKLILCFIVVSVVAAVVGGVGITNIKALDDSDTELYEKMTVPMDTVADILNGFQDIEIDLRNSLLTDNYETINACFEEIRENQTSIFEALEKLDGMVLAQDTRVLYEDVINKNNTFSTQIQHLETLVKGGQKAEVVALMQKTSEFGIATSQLEDAIEKFQHKKLKDAENKSDQNTVQANIASMQMIAVIIIGIIIAMALGFFLSNVISKPMLMLTEAAKKLAEGDLNIDIKANTTDEIGNLIVCFSKVTSNLSSLINEVSLMTKAAVEGKLDVRGSSQSYSGSYKEIIEGVNQTLDFVIEPVQEASKVLKEMSNGNLHTRVNGNYQGDHAELKNALNTTLDALSSYVSEISEVLNEMAGANLEVAIKNEYRGDFAPIKDALNLIVNAFNQVLGEVNGAAEQVAAGSNQVAASSMALSQGATEQASSIEELSASIEQISQQTKKNAKNANEAKEIAEGAMSNAVEGNRQMQEMLKAMAEINDSSNNISKIIKVIDEIAFQTNILALNAAVEAARAGQHGKGFAVVAEEVRNLAARSANAAKETTAMIEGSIKKAEGGTRIANVTAEALEDIVRGVSKAASLVSEIAAASEEQFIGVEQINQGIVQIAEAVQTTSATSQETASASEELSSQADMLKKQVGRFRLKTYNYTSNFHPAYEEAAVTIAEAQSDDKKAFGKY